MQSISCPKCGYRFRVSNMTSIIDSPYNVLSKFSPKLLNILRNLYSQVTNEVPKIILRG